MSELCPKRNVQLSLLRHLTLDANFCLKNLFHSTPMVDPGLHTGLAYFVKYVPYLHHLGKYVTQTDVSI